MKWAIGIWLLKISYVRGLKTELISFLLSFSIPDIISSDFNHYFSLILVQKVGL